MIIVNYEVYVLEQPRGWMLHARFPRQERESALAEAKELEQTLNVRVKVMRETYYTDDNVFEEAEVYISGMKGGSGKSAGPSKPAAPRPSPSAPSSPAKKPTKKPAKKSAPPPPTLDDEPPPRPRKQSSAKAHTLLGRLLAITALSLAAALGAIKMTPNIIVFLWDLGLKITVTPDTYGQVLFTVFVVTFIGVAVPLALRFLPRQTEIPTFRRQGAAPSAVQSNKELRKSLDKLAVQAMADAPPPEPEEDIPLPTPEDLPEILPGPDDDLPEIKPEPEDPEVEKRAKEEARKAREEAQKLAEEQGKKKDKEEADKASSSSAAADAQQPAVMRFLNGAVNAVKSAVPVLDSYNKFALHLYMAGGVETLCEFRKLGDPAKESLTATALETLGTKNDVARMFHRKLGEYLLEPRYLGVVQAGRDAMGDFLSGDETSTHRRIKDVMRDWNKPQEKKSSIVTVVFTDMVGSTDLTQERGDSAAQEIVRRHNSIVRSALAQFQGKEIKHTGDGIMASFGSAANAVEACSYIQREVMTNNQRTPDLELHLRIGLNAGEPIEEEDDLFGTTVQLSARVCAATNTDQILCTGVVKDLSFGKSNNFRSVGERNLKGFKDPIALYEVIWQ